MASPIYSIMTDRLNHTRRRSFLKDEKTIFFRTLRGFNGHSSEFKKQSTDFTKQSTDARLCLEGMRQQAGFQTCLYRDRERRAGFLKHTMVRRMKQEQSVSWTVNFICLSSEFLKGAIKPFGTADAVCQSLEQYPELQEHEFVVCNCDNFVQ